MSVTASQAKQVSRFKAEDGPEASSGTHEEAPPWRTRGKPRPKKTDPKPGTPSAEAYVVKNPEAFARNVARMLEGLGKAASAWVEPREKGEVVDTVSEPMADMVKTFSKVGEYWLSDPKRAIEAQTSLLTSYFGMWNESVKRMSGEDDSPKPKTKDKRFSDPDWENNPFFEFLKNAYFITSDWANKLVDESEGLDEHTRHKAAFYVRQITSALSPANFLATNPRALQGNGRLERREPGQGHAHAGRGHCRWQG
jgi:polyhydroxyalkanoate synthase